MFIEKPIHCGDVSLVEELKDLFNITKVIVSVGYMLRYHKGSFPDSLFTFF